MPLIIENEPVKLTQFKNGTVVKLTNRSISVLQCQYSKNVKNPNPTRFKVQFKSVDKGDKNPRAYSYLFHNKLHLTEIFLSENGAKALILALTNELGFEAIFIKKK